MPVSNTTTRYGSITRSFHWLTALLVMTLIPVALIAEDLPYDTSAQLAQKAWLFSLHKTLGVTVFFVALLRILWALSQPKPASLHPERRIENFLAETAHWLLYGSLVLAPLSGWIHHAATSGFAPIWWPLGQSLPMVPKSEGVAAFFGGLHWVFGKVMIVSLLLHIAGALKHHFIDKDATLRRIITGAPELANLPATRHARTPLVAALAIWAAVLAGGNLIGVYTADEGAQAATLADVASDWTVQEGSIAIAVTQFGSTVEGSFADWTADISFDPTISVGPSGTVEVVIAIGSLTLGSVTGQAMGPDFFDATQFETATFAADITTMIDGYVAEGTLTVKGVTLPVRLPFRLSVNGDAAEMSAQLQLNRLDFGVGTNMPDESSLAFAVDVAVALTATRANSQ
ncbi:cytochrome b/b6 domain-containing protein [Sulfitobacter guttiformis]|uniref:Cytochrome b561 n=1 Tax=Sulfitobacter guttiformis TaxID=74349 RepID=A0A420DIR6_9RHOB|nr:cytochrome b/b6 domain-containing protein [Sulfitobacter guttiformis]KIN72085.1 Cytochrome B561 [Sulfitobacter guttiformis KCTC 32187]RKE94136.1 cytochrome b561 [Sulfitobacter guttiformis]